MKKWIFEYCTTDQLREVILMYLLARFGPFPPIYLIFNTEFVRLHHRNHSDFMYSISFMIGRIIGMLLQYQNIILTMFFQH